MSWIVSEILYHKSVQTYDKSIDMLKWMQVGLRVPGAGSVPLRERQAQSCKFEFFQEKWESRWGCGDRTFHLISDLVRRSSCYIMYPLWNHLNYEILSKEFQGRISWSHSTLYLAYWQNLCSFWCFHVDVPSHGSHVYLRQQTSKVSYMRRLVGSRP